MGVLRAMRNLFSPRRHEDSCGTCPWAPHLAAMQAQAQARERELGQAKKANDRATLGVVATAGQALKTESGVQAMMRGVLGEVDRDVEH